MNKRYYPLLKNIFIIYDMIDELSIGHELKGGIRSLLYYENYLAYTENITKKEYEIQMDPSEMSIHLFGYEKPSFSKLKETIGNELLIEGLYLSYEEVQSFLKTFKSIQHFQKLDAEIIIDKYIISYRKELLKFKNNKFLFYDINKLNIIFEKILKQICKPLKMEYSGVSTMNDLFKALFNESFYFIRDENVQKLASLLKLYNNFLSYKKTLQEHPPYVNVTQLGKDIQRIEEVIIDIYGFPNQYIDYFHKIDFEKAIDYSGNLKTPHWYYVIDSHPFEIIVPFLNSIVREQTELILYNKTKKKRDYSIDIKEVVMGDVFKGISNSPIVNKSIVEKSFNKINSDFDEDTAKALVEVAEEIHKSGNKEAAELFEGFNEELQKPAPKKSLLRNLWEGIVKALPSLEKLAGIGIKIAKLFIS